jgi:hypothetical protein
VQHHAITTKRSAAPAPAPAQQHQQQLAGPGTLQPPHLLAPHYLQGLLDMPMLRRADRAAQLVAQRVDLAAITPDQVPLLLTAQELGERCADGYAALVAPALGGECNSKTGRCAGHDTMGCWPCACVFFECMRLQRWVAGCVAWPCVLQSVSAGSVTHVQAGTCIVAVAGLASRSPLAESDTRYCSSKLRAPP